MKINTPSGVKELEVSSTPVNIQEVSSLSIIRDVTERNRIERNNRIIIESSADLIFVIKDQKMVFINPRGAEYLGAESPEQILGNTSEIQIHPDYQGLVERYAKERRAGGTPQSTYRVKMIRVDGKEVDVEFNVSLIDWDGDLCSLVIGRDVGKQIEYDKKLEELHKFSAELVTLNDVQRIAELVVEASHKILGYKRVAFGVVRGDKFNLLYSDPRTDVMDLSLNGTGISTRALRTGIPQIVDDVRLDPDYIDSVLENEAPTISEYAIPIKLRGKSVALINIESEQVAAFDEEDTKLVTILVDHITSALEKLEYQKKLEALHQYSKRITECRTLEDVARETMTVVYDVLEHRFGAFGYIENDMLHFLEQKKSKLKGLPLNGKGITVRAVRTGESQLVNDVRLDPDYISSRLPEDTTTLSELDVSVKIDDKVVAVINLESSRVNRFQTEDKQLVETLAIHVSSTLKNIFFGQRIASVHQHTLILDKVDDTLEALVSTFKVLKDNLGFPVVDIIKVENGVLKDAMTADNNLYSLAIDGPGITACAARTGETQLVNDTSKDPDYHVGPDADKYLSELTVPVFRDEKIAYLINIERLERNAFNDEDKFLVELIGISLGQALSRIQRLELLEETVEE